jgi:hypothetical protein
MEPLTSDSAKKKRKHKLDPEGSEGPSGSEVQASDNNNLLAPPPTSPRRTFGDKQLLDLLNAIERETLYRTQGQSWASQKVKGSTICKFLAGKLEEQRSAATTHNTFAYLSAHIVGERPLPDEYRQLATRLENKFHLCKTGNTHLQCKLPCSDVPVTPSDRRNGKQIGLLQIQAYKLNEILRSGEAQVALSIRAYLEQENKIAAHLCKQKCLTTGHVSMVNAKINKQHDACPAWWIVNGKLVNFCSCASQARCLAPGPMFDPLRFARSLQTVLDDTHDPLLLQ